MHSIIDGINGGAFPFSPNFNKIDWADATLSSFGLKGVSGLTISVGGSSLIDFTVEEGFSSTFALGDRGKSIENTLIDFGVNSSLYGLGGIAKKYFGNTVDEAAKNLSIAKLNLKNSKISDLPTILGRPAYSSFIRRTSALKRKVGIADYDLTRAQNSARSWSFLQSQTFNASGTTGISGAFKGLLEQSIHIHKTDNTNLKP